MRAFLLLRHASAGGKPPGARDQDRPLSEWGRAEARLVGLYLAQAGRLPALILSSPALRATETAEVVAAALAYPNGDIGIDERLYLAEPREILAVVGEIHPTVDELLVVGHNPGLSQVAARSASDLGIILTPGSLAEISFDTSSWGEIAAGGGTLTSLVTPDDLR